MYEKSDQAKRRVDKDVLDLPATRRALPDHNSTTTKASIMNKSHSAQHTLFIMSAKFQQNPSENVGPVRDRESGCAARGRGGGGGAHRQGRRMILRT